MRGLELTLLANAKLNLTLDIAGQREDGYHLLDSVMQSVTLSDRLHLVLREAGEITVSTNNQILQNRDNIVTRAARLFFEAAGREQGASISLRKAIPISAGLGGGSADAAAVLYGLNLLCGQPLKTATLARLALRLGADVPFCLSGATARVGGVGEALEPLPPMPDCTILLIKKGRKPSTAEMYRRLDEACERDGAFLPGPFTPGTVDALRRGDYGALCARLGNAFEAVWDHGALEAELYGLGADRVSLSGSGPTCFALFSDALRAEAAYRILKPRLRHTYLCRPARSSVRVLDLRG